MRLKRFTYSNSQYPAESHLCVHGQHATNADKQVTSSYSAYQQKSTLEISYQGHLPQEREIANADIFEYLYPLWKVFSLSENMS